MRTEESLFRIGTEFGFSASALRYSMTAAPILPLSLSWSPRWARFLATMDLISSRSRRSSSAIPPLILSLRTLTPSTPLRSFEARNSFQSFLELIKLQTHHRLDRIAGPACFGSRHPLHDLPKPFMAGLGDDEFDGGGSLGIGKLNILRGFELHQGRLHLLKPDQLPLRQGPGEKGLIKGRKIG